MNASKLWILAIAGLSSVMAACGGDDLTLPGGTPANITVVDGNGQEGPIGSVLGKQLVVRVTDSDDRPVAGVSVAFVLDDAGEGGSVNPTTATTDSDGLAKASLTLGSRVGPISGHASVTVGDGVAPLRADFTATAKPAQATGVSVYAGNNQSAAVGTALSLPLVVQVTDGLGNPIVGTTVQWSVNGTDAGSVTPPTSNTDAQGLASAQWTLGSLPGTYTVSAIVAGVGTATFTATATAGAPSATNSTVSASPGTITAGVSTSTITVTVRDAANNPVSGASVTVSSSGTGNDITPATATSDESGVATFTFGSTVVETKTITATAGGVTLDQKPTINVQKASSTIRITSDEPDPSSVGETVRVEFTVTGSGGTPTGTVNVTVAGGPETCSGSVADGFCELTLTVAGNQRDITATYQGDARFNGSSDTERHHVNAQNGPPVAAFTPPACVAGQVCQFTDASTDPDGNIVSRTWDFGDGTPTSGETNPTHTYTTAGTYNVKLTVRDANAATSEVTHQVTVSPPANSPPVAVPDVYATPSGQPLIVPAPGVLVNDTDPDAGTALSAELASEPTSGGLVVFSSDGSFTYFPVGAAGSQDTFTYTVSDGTLTSTTTVTINIQ